MKPTYSRNTVLCLLAVGLAALVPTKAAILVITDEQFVKVDAIASASDTTGGSASDAPGLSMGIDYANQDAYAAVIARPVGVNAGTGIGQGRASIQYDIPSAGFLLASMFCNSWANIAGSSYSYPFVDGTGQGSAATTADAQFGLTFVADSPLEVNLSALFTSSNYHENGVTGGNLCSASFVNLATMQPVMTFSFAALDGQTQSALLLPGRYRIEGHVHSNGTAVPPVSGPGEFYENHNSGTFIGRLDLQFQATAVPEPENYAAFAGAGLLAFAIWRRGQRQA